MEPCVQSLRSEIQEAGMNKFVYMSIINWSITRNKFKLVIILRNFYSSFIFHNLFSFVNW